MSTPLADYTAAPQQLKVRAKLNLRVGPSTATTRVGRARPGEVLSADQLLDAEPYLNSSHWYRQTGTGFLFWAGGVEPGSAARPAPPLSMVVNQRSDGSIQPLSEAKIKLIFGDFSFAPATPAGAVQITTPGWLAAHLASFSHPVLAAVHPAAITLHQKAIPSFQAAFDAIQAAGLADRILSFNGSFVPRHKGWNPASGLSAHSWGIAIDLNTAWNGYGKTPAPLGSLGSVQELLPHFAAQGFAWGGDFASPDVDGMHFELARLDV
ncbi:hypothetical protein HNP55_000334 [Paucibacter oligotrophus]|uniref:Peptidase M15C domain-containing protein n=1 Tax=Roseateles oligotrophus TaxID=1769250 RepID=A0A840L6Q0_9BURK|nr:M15 family metallopeptidase [Roseateles oligotrophus]MBB4841839.1 hypothetical protein [Roseateles oligotrophus]